MPRLTAAQKAALAASNILHFHKLSRYKPYPWQKIFHDAGRTTQERMLRAANRVGKTMSAAAEMAMHLSGEYPAWWEGKKFKGDVLAWTGSPTNLTSRDIVQTELLGAGLGKHQVGTGMVPKHCIKGRIRVKQAGIADVADYFETRRSSGGADVSGGHSKCILKTYDQGWRTWQGAAPHVVWDDEEPSKGAFPNEEDYRVYTEAQTRIMTTNGIIMVTFTPLYGQTALVEHFDKKLPGTAVFNATWDDAPHLSQEDKLSLYQRYPEHEREARSKGIPMLGSGRIFAIDESEIKFDASFLQEIPSHWAQIVGCDFGIDHPAAGCWIAWDRDSDVIYVIDCYKKSGETAPYHASILTRRGNWIPVAWPHDGHQRDKGGSGVQLHMAYRRAGVTGMLSKSARYSPVHGVDKGGAQPQWPIIEEIYDRMRTGRFKIASHLGELWQEVRGYHTKDGKIVPRNDDIIKAMMYGMMMKRYATPERRPVRHRASRPIVSAAI